MPNENKVERKEVLITLPVPLLAKVDKLTEADKRDRSRELEMMIEFYFANNKE